MSLKAATQVCLGLLGSSLGPSLVTQSAYAAAYGSFSSAFTLGPQLDQSRTSPAGYHTSSLCSQQQQQDGGKSRGPTINEQSKEVSKSFITSVLNMEEAWLSGVAGQLKMWAATKKLPELEGGDKGHPDVVEKVRSEYLAALERAAAGRELSIRARSHLKQACLAAATHKVLLELSPGSEQHIDEFIMFNLGGVYSTFMVGGLKMSSWAKKWLLRESSTSQAVDTLHTIARDMEGACHCSIQPLCAVSESDDDSHDHPQQQAGQQEGTPSHPESQQQHEDPEAVAEAEAKKLHTQQQWQQGAALTVDSCMVAEVLKQEGVPQLNRYFCCQHNMMWLKAYDKQGVNSSLSACIATGDGCCRIVVKPSL